MLLINSTSSITQEFQFNLLQQNLLNLPINSNHYTKVSCFGQLKGMAISELNQTAYIIGFKKCNDNDMGLVSDKKLNLNANVAPVIYCLNFRNNIAGNVVVNFVKDESARADSTFDDSQCYQCVYYNNQVLTFCSNSTIYIYDLKSQTTTGKRLKQATAKLFDYNARINCGFIKYKQYIAFFAGEKKQDAKSAYSDIADMHLFNLETFECTTILSHKMATTLTNPCGKINNCVILCDSYLLCHNRNLVFCINLEYVVKFATQNGATGRFQKRLKSPKWTKLDMTLAPQFSLISNGTDFLAINNEFDDSLQWWQCYLYQNVQLHPKKRKTLNLNSSRMSLRTNVDYLNYNDLQYRYDFIGNGIILTIFDAIAGSVAIKWSPLWSSHEKATILNDKYILLDRLGSGGSATVYNAKLIGNYTSTMHNDEKNFNSKVVIKQQSLDSSNSHSSLFKEFQTIRDINRKISDFQVCGTAFEYFEENGMGHIVFEKLGVSLQHLFIYNKCKFDLQRVLMIFDQMIVLLNKLHSIGYCHNDIKPENILIGNNSFSINKIYLIDFGLCSKYWDFKNNKHISESKSDSFVGTFRFASKNHHCNEMTHARRDDLESLMYVLIYFLCNKLPWMIDYNKFYTKDAILNKTKNIKQDITVNEICSGASDIDEFKTALEYVRQLKFEQCPDYQYLQNLFYKLYRKRFLSISNNMVFKWFGTTNEMINNSANIHAFGARVDVSQPRQYGFNENEAKAEMESKQDVDYDSSVGSSISPISHKFNQFDVIPMDNKFKKLYDKYQNQMAIDGAIIQTNVRTHASIHGIRNRMGYLIDCLIIKPGFPTKQPHSINYAGMIVYTPFATQNNNVQLKGEIYALPVDKCYKIKNKYNNNKQNHAKGYKLGGQIHGALYYYYFQTNIQLKTEQNKFKYIDKLKFIRGFSIYSQSQTKYTNSKNEIFCFNSKVFNFDFERDKYFDDHYRSLPQCESDFLKHTIERYWENNKNTSLSYNLYMQNNVVAKKTDFSALFAIGEDKSLANRSQTQYKNNNQVPQYATINNTEQKIHAIYKRVMLHHGLTLNIIDFLSKNDQLQLFVVSKQSFNHVWQYCVSKSTSIFVVSFDNSVCHIKQIKSSQSPINATNPLDLIYQRRNNNMSLLLLINYYPLPNQSVTNAGILHSKMLNENYYFYNHNNNTLSVDHEYEALKRQFLHLCDNKLLSIDQLWISGDEMQVTDAESKENAYQDVGGTQIKVEWSWLRGDVWNIYTDETSDEIEKAYKLWQAPRLNANRAGYDSIRLSSGVFGDPCNSKFYGKYLIHFNTINFNIKPIDYEPVKQDLKSNNFTAKYFYQQNVTCGFRVVRRLIVNRLLIQNYWKNRYIVRSMINQDLLCTKCQIMNT